MIKKMKKKKKNIIPIKKIKYKMGVGLFAPRRLCQWIWLIFLIIICFSASDFEPWV